MQKITPQWQPNEKECLLSILESLIYEGLLATRQKLGYPAVCLVDTNFWINLGVAFDKLRQHPDLIQTITDFIPYFWLPEENSHTFIPLADIGSSPSLLLAELVRIWQAEWREDGQTVLVEMVTPAVAQFVNAQRHQIKHMITLLGPNLHHVCATWGLQPEQYKALVSSDTLELLEPPDALEHDLWKYAVMTPATLLTLLKPYAEKAIRQGDFLISTNTLSKVWLSDLNSEAARPWLRGLLQGFWEAYLAQNPGDYLLLSIEQFAAMSAGTLSATSLLVKDVAALVKHPRLYCDKVFVDPDSFEVFLDDHPPEVAMLILVEPSVPHDLLLAVCRHLHEQAYTVKGVLTTIERKQRSDALLHPDLQIEFIPLFVYDEQTGRLAAVTELHDEPYGRYHGYFSA